MRVPKLAALLAVVPLVLAVAACGSDDGSDVRQVGSNAGSASGSGSGSASGSGSGSASGTGSGSGISTTGLDTTSSDPLIQAAVADYTTYVNGRVDQLIARTTTFTDAVRAGNVAAAKAAFAPSREPWESIEPIAGLIPDIDERLTRALTTSRGRTTRRSRGGIASSTCCGRGTPPRAAPSSRPSSTRTSRR